MICSIWQCVCPMSVETQQWKVAESKLPSENWQKTITLHFSTPPLGDLEAGYGVHLRLIGKRVVDSLLVIIER